jgi:hypothetical protein
VRTNGGVWRVTGAKHRLELNSTNLAFRVETASNTWQMRESSDGDLRVRHGTNTVSLRLATAGRKQLTSYENGFEKGMKLELGGFRSKTDELDITLQLFLCFEGAAEDLVTTLIASDGLDRVQRCDWPAPLVPESFETTVVPFMQGMLLPKNWPEKTRL